MKLTPRQHQEAMSLRAYVASMQKQYEQKGMADVEYVLSYIAVSLEELLGKPAKQRR